MACSSDIIVYTFTEVEILMKVFNFYWSIILLYFYSNTGFVYFFHFG